MTKRRLDDDDLVNLLRQKHKEDPEQKQQAARHTFAMLMRAQQSPMTPSTTDPGPSYQYFNNSNPWHMIVVIIANIIYAKTAYNNAIYVNMYIVPPVQISTTPNLQIKCFACRVHKASNDASEYFL
ncbi:proteasome regulatory particle subunit [Mucor velutinosus]|uniref:Proteasome regulatory particle subunit n=1 Tax=Mucor velutinosus TaxID=708070 RepID=A0AAN7HXI7_9FUNG|nr:proteasome regulatory particle subunit [Mucor velutinosus]